MNVQENLSREQKTITTQQFGPVFILYSQGEHYIAITQIKYVVTYYVEYV